MLRIRLTLCALLLAAVPAHAGIDNAGTTAANFLSVGTGAGILSMGGATLGSGHDLNAAAWNPAALAQVNGSQFSLSHASLNAQASQEWAAAGGRVAHGQTRWSANMLYQSEGAIDGTDASGNSTGSFDVANMAFGVGVAHPFGDAISAGAGVRYVNEKLGDVSGSGLGIDLGAQAHAGAFGFGVAGRNLGGKMKYTSGSYDLPSVIGVGASWTNAPSGLRLGVDANFPKAYYNEVRLGGEWLWQERVALRAGYRMELNAPTGEPLGGPTFGFGAGVAGMWMDYAFLAGQSDAQGQHRFGLTFHPGMLNAGQGAPIATRVGPPAPAAAIPTPVAAKSAPAPQPVAAAPAPVAPAPAPVAPAPLAFEPVTDASAPPAAPRVTNAAIGPPLAVSKPVRVPKLGATKVAAVPAPRHAAAAAAAPAPVAVAPNATPAPAPDAPAPSTAPAVAQVAATPAPMETVVKPAPAPPPPAPAAPAVDAAPQPRPATISVGKNETLYTIAKRWNTSAAAIMMENDMVSESIHQGQKLKLPPADKH